MFSPSPTLPGPSPESLSNGSLPLSAHIVPLADNYPSPSGADDLARWLHSSSSNAAPGVGPRSLLPPSSSSPLCNGLSSSSSSSSPRATSPIRNGSSSSSLDDDDDHDNDVRIRGKYQRSSVSSSSSLSTPNGAGGTTTTTTNGVSDAITPSLKRSIMKEVRRPGKNFNHLFSILSDVQHPPPKRLLLVRMAQMEAVRFKRRALVEMLQNLDDLLVEDVERANG